jgi:hypothetical protein
VQNVDPDDLIGKAYDARIARRLFAYVLQYERRAAFRREGDDDGRLVVTQRRVRFPSDPRSRS